MKDLRTRIKDCLVYYPLLCQGGRMPSASDDKLGVQRIRQESAPFEDTAVFKASIEQAMKVMNEDVMICLHYYVVTGGRDMESVKRLWGLPSTHAAYRSVNKGLDRLVEGYLGARYRKRRRNRKLRSKLVEAVA